ncbi:2-phosphoglycolate phosphatase [Gloeophyllum trabeum ATCC 11539]|uniref:4-nitrophenylphosphatase n=1 Tax=Gloeophyllum trabeum (strain ATCC 11539 / FP-39264 / Madison 617) TaxID=670483 RepID=S7RE72_GLOTA|nr:2-phosphoglycolate phosphatase [Gloeophyllum trabeum ATCC 11539]EPQ50774.1 2-phosphoglycolate phosphatase [Gloeophyllum trabeum ATCC 11539]
MSARLSSKEDYESLLDKYDTWMFDCDGVLWNGDRLVDGAVKVLEILRSHKKSVLFVTNNATKSRQSYKKKFDKLGVEAHVDEIFGSAYASAVYISSVMKLPKDKKVYVVGMEGLEQELTAEGISYVGGTDPADYTLEPFSLSNFTPDPAVDVVLCGLDTAINYTKLSKAFQYLQKPQVTFLVTNDDSTYPSEGGLLPGAGAISAPLKTASGREPLSIGKPAKTMLDCIKAKHNFDPERTLMVGDRLNTDILFGQAGGVSTLLVLTGITHVEDITGPNASTIVPDYVTSSIGDLRVLA